MRLLRTRVKSKERLNEAMPGSPDWPAYWRNCALTSALSCHHASGDFRSTAPKPSYNLRIFWQSSP